MSGEDDFEPPAFFERPYDPGLDDPELAHLISAAAVALNEARIAVLQVPERLGHVMRSSVESALGAVEAALKASPEEFRGDLAAVHALLLRRLFPEEEHARLFNVLAALNDTLRAAETAASGEGYPSNAEGPLPREKTRPAAAKQSEIAAVRTALEELAMSVDALDDADGAARDPLETELINVASDGLRAKATIGQALCGDALLDTLGLDHAIAGIGRIAAGLEGVVQASEARVSPAIRQSSVQLSDHSARVVQVGRLLSEGSPGSLEFTLPQRSPIRSPHAQPVPNLAANLIVCVGRPGSGKSTLQSALLRYLLQSGDYLTRLVNEAKDADIAGKELVWAWQQDWRQGRFPARTRVGDPTAVRVQVSPTRRSRASLEFSFLDFSGETFASLTRAQHLHPSELAFLDDAPTARRSKLVFLFVCNADNVVDDDMLFRTFLDYLHQRRQYEDTPIAVVIMNPTIALARLKYHDHSADADTFRPEQFLKMFLPMTFANLKFLKRRATLMLFSVGKVQRMSDGQPYIADPESEDARRLFTWIFWQFTGIRPSARWLGALQRFLRELG